MPVSNTRPEPVELPHSEIVAAGPAPGKLPRPKQARQKKRGGHVADALYELAAIVESCDDAIIGQRLDGAIASWNAAAERIYGYPSAEVVGQPISILMPPDRKSEMEQILERIKLGQRVDHFETIRVRKDGRKINISLTVSPIRDASGRIVAASGVGRDITERFELELQKDEFLSLASHELRTPVTTIKGFADLALRLATDSANTRLARYLSTISDQADHLSRLVNDLLNVTWLESGLLPLHAKQFDLLELIEESARNAELLGSGFSIALYLPRRRVMVDADRHLIQEVLANLIDNAVKYSVGSRQVEISVTVTGNEAITAVRDFGMGITPGQESKVFDRFYRAANSSVRTHRGLGLGLYISRNIIERHAGRMWLESSPDAGSTFYFALPTM
jgi:PAS domain S-box-containing protein